MLRRLLGDDFDPALRPVLLSVGLAAVGQFAFFSFFAIWALEELDARQAHVGLAYAASALAAIAGGILGGRLSDRAGRRPVVVAASVGQTLLPAVLLVPGLPAVGGFAVLAGMGFLQPFRGTAQRALIADLTPPEERMRAFGAHRVVLNVGAAAGPLLAAALVAVGWPAVHAAIALVYALSGLAARVLPDPRPEQGTDLPSLRLLLADRGFLLVFAAALASWSVYNAYEVLFPVALTQTHGLSPSAWGPLYVINAVVVVLFQLRVTRWAGRLGTGPSLVAAMLLMGFPFLALLGTGALPAILAIVLVFVLGEMLWAPGSEALVTRLAPPGTRGVYLGTMGAATWAGAAVAPAAGLALREAFGDAAMWLGVAIVAVAAAALYAAAARRTVIRTEGVRSAAFSGASGARTVEDTPTTGRSKETKCPPRPSPLPTSSSAGPGPT
jgi:predicted MFS family arabinose efflux permease